MMGTTMGTMTSTTFMGPEVKAGRVTGEVTGGMKRLALSDDFTVPGAPAPHWRVIDSAGNAYLLDRLVTAGERFHKSVSVPTYVADVASVQIYCAFAEVVLGEASFAPALR
jgi:hypothetical protein